MRATTAMLRANAQAFARVPLPLACASPLARVRAPLLRGAARCAATCAAAPAPPAAAAAPPELTALYDGSCPVCVAEISFLRTFARAPRVAWVDASARDFDAAAWSAAAGVQPLSRTDLLSEMHVLDARGGSGGALRKRVPAFRALYAVVSGRDWLAFTARAPFAALSDGAYELARRHKHRLAFLFPRCEPCAR